MRVVSEEGKNLGIFSKKDALRLAQEKGLDLVLVAEEADPPVAKIIDFHKYLYQQRKKHKKEKQGSKKSVVKEIRISLFMGENDKKRFIEKAKEFINEGFQVKFNLVLRGRQIERKDRAIKLLKEMAEKVENSKIVKEPKVEGNVARMILAKK